jgi:hypothetical protein
MANWSLVPRIAQHSIYLAREFDSCFPVIVGPTGAATDFAMNAGGGLDVRIAGHVDILPIEADYFLTNEFLGLGKGRRRFNRNRERVN